MKRRTRISILTVLVSVLFLFPITGPSRTNTPQAPLAYAPDIDHITAQLGNSNSVYGNFSTNSIGTYRNASLSLNGGTTFTIAFPATDDWNEIVTLVISVPRNAGSNTTPFSNASSYTPDIDKIDAV